MCYWIPGIVTKGVTVVITPLLALLNGQVSKLRNYGIPVCYVTSSLQTQERDSIFHQLTKPDPKYKFFYITPEFALTPQASSCFKAIQKTKPLVGLLLMRLIVWTLGVAVLDLPMVSL